MDWSLWPSPWTILSALVAAAVGYGVYKNIIARLIQDVEKHTKEIHGLKEWGENELEKALKDRNDNFVRLDLFKQCMGEFSRRMDAYDALKIGAQLAEIKAMLVGLKEQLKNK